jgi:hypothetical protein
MKYIMSYIINMVYIMCHIMYIMFHLSYHVYHVLFVVPCVSCIIWRQASALDVLYGVRRLL